MTFRPAVTLFLCFVDQGRLSDSVDPEEGGKPPDEGVGNAMALSWFCGFKRLQAAPKADAEWRKIVLAAFWHIWPLQKNPFLTLLRANPHRI